MEGSYHAIRNASKFFQQYHRKKNGFPWLLSVNKVPEFHGWAPPARFLRARDIQFASAYTKMFMPW
jgi:hypothetical protein